MDSTRALFASIGASAALVAAAALSLFAVSVVIAFGGWSAGLGESEPVTTLVFSGSAAGQGTAAEAGRAQGAPVVLRAPAAAERSRHANPVHAVAQRGTDARARVISHSVAVSDPPQGQIVQPPPMAHPQPALRIPAAGDGVRRVGEDLSSTAQHTGQALADLTAPLGPPVSAAVQTVLDLVAALLRRTTNGLGGTLDTATGRR